MFFEPILRIVIYQVTNATSYNPPHKDYEPLTPVN